jgi:hypothetical protein
MKTNLRPDTQKHLEGFIASYDPEVHMLTSMTDAINQLNSELRLIKFLDSVNQRPNLHLLMLAALAISAYQTLVTETWKCPRCGQVDVPYGTSPEHDGCQPHVTGQFYTDDREGVDVRGIGISAISNEDKQP